MSSVSKIYKVESQMSCKGRLNLQDKTSVYLVWNKITPSCFMQRKSDHPWPDKPPSLCCRPYLTSEGKHVARHLNSSCYRNSLDFWYLMCGVDQDLKFYLLVYFYLFYPIAEVSERFLKEASKEQKTTVLRKCITSIATRCKTLRYNRSKIHVANHWAIHTNQLDNEDVN